MLMNNDPDAFVKLNMMNSSSPLARKDIGQVYEHKADRIHMNPEAKNRNIEILDVDFKMLGIELCFE